MLPDERRSTLEPRYYREHGGCCDSMDVASDGASSTGSGLGRADAAARPEAEALHPIELTATTRSPTASG